jgi:tRNA 2-thiouridine synthesizing protein A
VPVHQQKRHFSRLTFSGEVFMSDYKQVAEDVIVTFILDTKNLSSPIPLLRAKKEIAKLTAGDVLQIKSTDSGSRNDLRGWCQRSGNEYLGEKEEETFINFFIRKS